MTSSHWQTPLRGKPAPSVHVLLWQDADTSDPKKGSRARSLQPGRRRAWKFVCTGKSLGIDPLDSWLGPMSLAVLLDQQRVKGHTLTVWLARGWTDLVLTGLADLIDGGAFTWKYALLDGARCLFRGQLDGASTVITSLPCWTGGRWDAWPECAESQPVRPMLDALAQALSPDQPAPKRDERLALATVATILASSTALEIGSVRPTVAGQAKQLWRAWLGPRVWVGAEPRPTKKGRPARPPRCYVAPLPSRPDACANAERHICYGMPREQLYSGRFEGPIHIVDMAQAYLAALMLTPAPTVYRECLRSPSIRQLAESLCGSTGLALMLVDSPNVPYPVRRRGRSGRAVGRFWTWLAGEELAQSIIEGHAQECHTAWLWAARRRKDAETERILTIRPAMLHDQFHGLAAAWRALYCALVGQWATWGRQWTDVDYPHNFGRWAAWSGADPDSGEEVRYRAIGGRVQRLGQRESAPGTVPLCFGAVTAALRCMLREAISAVGPGQTVAISADALWVTDAGLLRIRDLLDPQDPLAAKMAVKASYDRAWLTGTGRAVVERDGRRYAILSGVPHDQPADATGRIAWQRTAEWMEDREPSAAKGVRVYPVGFDAERLVRDYDYPCRPECPWLRLQDGQLVEELLTPRQRGKGVDDGDE